MIVLLLGLSSAADVLFTPTEATLFEEALENMPNWGWHALTAEDWQGIAERHLALVRATEWTDIDDERTRFLMLTEMGRASEEIPEPVAPFFVRIDETPVNAGWYAAAQLARAKPESLSWIIQPESYHSVKYYVDAIDSGKVPDGIALSMPELLVGRGCRPTIPTEWRETFEHLQDHGDVHVYDGRKKWVWKDGSLVRLTRRCLR